MYFSNLLRRTAALVLLVMLMTACGGGGGGSAPASASVPAPELVPRPVVPVPGNQLNIRVDSGPAGGTGYHVNRLYASVTICLPGSSTKCQTIDHVLVDTGSTGLRLLSSAMATGLNLTRLTANNTVGLPLLNCVQFVDNTFAWGSVVAADIVLGGKTAASVPIQVIADPVFNIPPVACSGGATAITSVDLLGAKGIIGMGLFKEDCGDRCVGNSGNAIYYTCTDASCAATQGATASLAQQVKNPVPLFAADNNGVLIDLPAVSLSGAPSLDGSLYFGVNTQSNNQLNTASVLTTSALGFVTTQLGPQSMTTSYIDSGSNGLFFYSGITSCGSSGPGFYCPASRVTLSASLRGANAVSSAVISFSIDKATDLFGDGVNHVFPTLAGGVGRTSTFDWGLPFFYGRRVFVGIEGLTPSIATGGFYAF